MYITIAANEVERVELFSLNTAFEDRRIENYICKALRFRVSRGNSLPAVKCSDIRDIMYLFAIELSGQSRAGEENINNRALHPQENKNKSQSYFEKC